GRINCRENDTTRWKPRSRLARCQMANMKKNEGSAKLTRPRSASAVGSAFVAASLPTFSLFGRSNHNGHDQEGRRNGGGILARAPVLAVEQSLQFFLQVSGSSVLFRRLER